MSSLVLGVAGAAIGAQFGFASLGWSIGSAVGTMMERREKTTVYGPRVTDLRSQVSTYGASIPLAWGNIRLAGNIIWMQNIREHALRKKVSGGGGKGGGGSSSTTYVTYTYTVSLAVSICRGPITGIRRIWADGEMIYDNSSNAGVGGIVATNILAGYVRIYLGDETQLPDPTIEAVQGVGNVPAYRGQAYVVFTDLDVTKYGARIPNFTFELSKGTTPGAITTVHITSSVGSDDSVRQCITEQGFFWDTVAVSSKTYLRCVHLPSGTLVADINITYADTGWFLGHSLNGVTPEGDAILAAYNGGIYNNRTLVFSKNGGFRVQANNYSIYAMVLSSDGTIFTSTSTAFMSVLLWIAADGTTGACIPTEYPPGSSYGSRDYLTYSSGVISGLVVGLRQTVDGFYYSLVVSTAGRTGVPYLLSVPGIGITGAPVFCVSPDGYLYVAHRDSSGAYYTISKFTIYGQHIASATPYTYALDINPSLVYYTPNRVATFSGTICRIFDTSNMGLIRTITMPADFYRPVSIRGSSNGGLYIQTASGIKLISESGAISDASIPVADIIEDLCGEIGLDPSDVDTSQVSATVAGFVIASRSPARDGLRALMDAHFIDATEGPNSIRFVQRGIGSVATIESAEVVAEVE